MIKINTCQNFAPIVRSDHERLLTRVNKSIKPSKRSLGGNFTSLSFSTPNPSYITNNLMTSTII